MIHRRLLHAETASLEWRHGSRCRSVVRSTATGGQPWSETREMWSENGSIHVRLEATDPLEVWKAGERIPQEVEHEADWWPWSVKRGLDHAIGAIAADQLLLVTPLQARATLRTIRAAYESAGLGRRIVMLGRRIVMADHEGGQG